MANWHANNVGVYFDDGAEELCVNSISDIGIFHMYVVISNMTSAGVKGFELQLASDGPISYSNYAFPEGYGAMNFQSPPSFMVGFAMPIPAVDRMVAVMEFDILIYSTNPVNWDENQDAHVYVKEIFFHSLPEEVPCYANDLDELVEMHQSTGTELDAVTIFSLDSSGCGYVVASDETSWDSLKSLYR